MKKKIHTNVLLKFEPTGKKSEAKIPFYGIYENFCEQKILSRDINIKSIMNLG